MQEDSIVHLRLHTLKLAKCSIQLPNTVPKYDFLALGTPSKSLNQEFSLYPPHCASSKLLDYLSFSAFQPPDRPRVVPLSTLCVLLCVAKKICPLSQKLWAYVIFGPHSSSATPLAPWLLSFSLNKEVSFAGVHGLYWNGGTMSWMREPFWYWRWSREPLGVQNCPGTPAW